jgi:putative transposase
MRPKRADNYGTYFVTSRTWSGRSLFQTDRMAELFLATLYGYREQAKYQLHQFVLMPDHFHLILTPAEITLERAVQLVKGGFSHRAGREIAANLEIWQKGFTDHRIRDAEDYAQHCVYMRANPVRAGLCTRPEEYPYSSASGRYELDPTPQRLKPLL